MIVGKMKDSEDFAIRANESQTAEVLVESTNRS